MHLPTMSVWPVLLSAIRRTVPGTVSFQALQKTRPPRDVQMTSETVPEPSDEDVTPTFEEAVSELQAIVGHLEDGSLPLQESMLQFERGVSLLRNCYQVLEQAEQRIEVLTSLEPDGSVETAPFDGSSTMEQRSANDGGTNDASAKPRSRAKRSSPRDDASSLF